MQTADQGMVSQQGKNAELGINSQLDDGMILADILANPLVADANNKHQDVNKL